MIHLGVNYEQQVWSSFNGWLRTIRKPLEPSELVVSNALGSTLPNYLRARAGKLAWVNLIGKYTTPTGPEMQQKVA